MLVALLSAVLLSVGCAAETMSEETAPPTPTAEAPLSPSVKGQGIGADPCTAGFYQTINGRHVWVPVQCMGNTVDESGNPVAVPGDLSPTPFQGAVAREESGHPSPATAGRALMPSMNLVPSGELSSVEDVCLSDQPRVSGPSPRCPGPPDAGAHEPLRPLPKAPTRVRTPAGRAPAPAGRAHEGP